MIWILPATRNTIKHFRMLNTQMEDIPVPKGVECQFLLGEPSTALDSRPLGCLMTGECENRRQIQIVKASLHCKFISGCQNSEYRLMANPSLSKVTSEKSSLKETVERS